MNFVVGRLVGYAEANLELSRFDSAKLRFMLELIFLNTAQMIALTAFFTYMGKAVEFFILMGVLMSVRLFAGGMHFKKYRYCFIFSSTVFAAIIFVMPDVSNTYALEALLLVTILINFALAPVSKRNSAHPAKTNLFFKIFSTTILVAYAVFLVTSRDNPYVSIITWILLVQSIQLIFGKVMLLRETNKRARLD